MENGVWMENGNIVGGVRGMHLEENPLPMSGYLGLFETCMSGYLGPKWPFNNKITTI